MKAVIYHRVSTDTQKEFGYSLAAQEKLLIAYCNQHGYDIIKSYQEDHSAKSFARPAFQEFLADLKSKRIKPDLFLVTKLDRFSRKHTSTTEMIAQLAKYGVEVMSLAEGKISFTTSESYLRNTVQSAFAEFDNIQRAENTTKGMREALKQGNWVWRAPIGYKNNTETKTLSICPEKSNFVQEAFRLMATGDYSADQVRKIMLKKGFKTAKTTFFNLLKNPFYTGKIRINASKQLNEPEMIVDGRHHPIIDPITFDIVQNIINGKTRKFPKSQTRNENLPLRGHLICEICGRHLTGSGSKSRNQSIHFYYHCQNDCKERFRADYANKEFVTYLDALQIKREVLELYYEVLKDFIKKDDKDRMLKVKTLNIEIEKQKERIMSLNDKFIDGQIEQKDYHHTKIRYETNLNDLQSEFVNYSASKSEFQKYIDFGFTMLSNLARYYVKADTSVKQKIIGSIFPEKLVFNKKNYRTTKLNSFLSINPMHINELPMTKEKSRQHCRLSLLFALPSGLEPETL
jgi:DNA invertase Pin-like site-specific DNA recombinase